MQAEEGYLIDSVTPGSPAAAAGISAGERLLRVDNQPVKDIIEFKIMEADDRVRLLLLAENGRLRRVTIRKPAGRSLGIQFSPPTMAPLSCCRNRCLFCFVDQNPRGLRKSLYLKDDDYRLSFLYGNFITLNHLTAAERKRITKLRLSPLYVSIHATDPAVRGRLFGSAQAACGLEHLRALVDAGICFHLQVVLCPGYNTGPVLEQTIDDLARLGPGVLSVALVPVGLTAHRRAGPPLRRLERGDAREVLAQVSRRQELYLRSRGSRLVFAADEIYNLAGEPYPPAEVYEGFPQLENGVGAARLFLDELAALPQPPLGPLRRPLKATLATGREAAPLLQRLQTIFASVPGLTLELAVIENRFFGSPVSVAGLLTGADLEAGLKGKDLGEAVFISKTLLKEGSDLFLDDLDLPRLEQSLQVTVRAVSGPRELARALRGLATAPAPAVEEA